MSIFEAESYYIKENKEKEYEVAMRDFLQWVNSHRELFPEWKSLRYFSKYIAGEETDRHFVVWEYESLADFEAYKKRRGNYEGAYAEYKKHDPYYKDVFSHIGMKVEVWKGLERDLWLE